MPVTNGPFKSPVWHAGLAAKSLASDRLLKNSIMRNSGPAISQEIWHRMRDLILTSIARDQWFHARRLLSWSVRRLRSPREKFAKFRCNVCGKNSSFPRRELTREQWSCRHCGSTVRWRSVVHALSVALFGESLVIQDFPDRPNLIGIGMSDWDGYALRLSRKLGYTNTYYHKDPKFDITCIENDQSGRYDFIISSDVFEHVCAPISRAFENSYRLLKPGGVMILTVPCVDGDTREHFPNVRRFSIEREGESFVLVGITEDGSIEKHNRLIFHGGPGTTVECRIFGSKGLMRECESAGFDSVRILDDSVERFGIVWSDSPIDSAPHARGIVGLNAPPWLLAKR